VSPEGWFVTAAHVVTENGRPDGPVRSDIHQAWLMKEARPGQFMSGMCQAVTFEYIDPITDFALLKVDFAANSNKDHLKDRSGFYYIEVSSRELEEGEPTYAFGYPLSQSHILFQDQNTLFGHSAHSPRVTSAIVSSTMEHTEMVRSSTEITVYVLDKALNYGNSGGPIISTDTGKVHAICSRFQPTYIPQSHLKDDKGNHLSIMIPSLYGVVASLSSTRILNQLRSRDIPISDE